MPNVVQAVAMLFGDYFAKCDIHICIEVMKVYSPVCIQRNNTCHKTVYASNVNLTIVGKGV